MDFSRRSPHPTCSLWKCWSLLCLSLAFYQDQIDAYSVTAQYMKYVCPEGQNVNLTCTITGHSKEHHEQLAIHWTYSKERNPDCTDKKHPGDRTENDLHDAHKRDFLHGKVFHKTIMNISVLNSGGYCCFLHEKHNRHTSHSYIDFQVKTDDPNLKTCSFYSQDPDSDGTTAGALAIVACIVGILCLPLILVLVYKQRKAVTNRRAQELVRMDSEAGIEGIENPVFDDVPVAHTEQRPKLIFMASRQPSDSGRHLLSEPNTPLSPYGPNDCFFPSLEPVPDSPDPV
ncbi:V-type immunoglobulin domain-containing suppressor of T-cell activation [Hyla sarda]|uniref:V-type immunoglobulin domain-containing suppressor of T-cell activation n=1 Tax=Hyla sarda TaxID=327740 RepID=UPI0024C2DE3A|nr:V-type immunoglobulin domain-containing suppressor of T-cell activation [Hyla sarda]XP_056386690.1 V-type immunoglobulin domain-containing suppressor of T-cell activation [Hyla sarda]